MSGKNPDIKEIHSRLFDVADKVFPELQLERYAGGWRSSRKLDGSEPHIKRKDKTVITSAVPYRLLEQGGESVSFWDYIANRDGLAGSTNKEVYKRIYELAGYDLEQLKKDTSSPSLNTKEQQEDASLSLLLEYVNKKLFIDIWKVNAASTHSEVSKPAKAVLDYLRNNRGYSDEEIAQMELGYLPSQEGILTLLKMSGRSEEDFNRLGIATVGRNYQLVIPLRCKGILRGFSFRDINHSAESRNPKYLNNTGLKKTNFLFNLPVGKIDGDLVLVEGELDALAATAKGIPNVAAIKGSSSLSAEQLELIKEASPKRVVLCLDSDEAGEKATEKIKEQLLIAGYPCLIASLPGGYDPDSYIRDKGADALFTVLQEAKTFSSYKIKGLDTSCTSFLDLEARLVNRPDALKTGYESLDKEIRIPVGAITLVAGRPRHGKTTVMYNLLLSMAEVYQDKKFYFFSYEESEADILLKILNRLVATDLNLNYMRRYEGAITNLQIIERYIKAKHTDIKEIEAGKGKLDALLKTGRIQILDEPHKVEKLAQIIQAANNREKIGAVFIDYIQRVGTEAVLDIRASMVKVSDELRKLAVSTGLPLIIGAQFGREGVGRKNEDQTASKPSLQALKEAGNLEEDANLVLRVWNAAVESDDTSSEVDLEIATLKSRSGNPSARANLKFKPQLGLIEESSQQTNTSYQVRRGISI